MARYKYYHVGCDQLLHDIASSFIFRYVHTVYRGVCVPMQCSCVHILYAYVDYVPIIDAQLHDSLQLSNHWFHELNHLNY